MEKNTLKCAIVSADTVTIGGTEMCAIFGIQSFTDASVLTLWGLHALQHRGHESFGIAVRNKDGIDVRRKMGLVGKMLESDTPIPMHGTAAISHTRYSTSGNKHTHKARALENTHPFCARIKYGEEKYGDIALAHNGNITNADTLRDQLYSEGRVFKSSDSDTEVLVHLIAKAPGESFVGRLMHALDRIEGAYSLLILTEKKLVAVRDPYGTHPLVMGKLGNAYVFASETCGLNIIHAEYVRDVEPGEIVVIENGNEPHSIRFRAPQPRHCLFETIYTMHPGSLGHNGKVIDETREAIGRQLARETYVRADMVVPAPASGNPYAIGFAEESGINFRFGLLRNHYTGGRAFIEPTDARRNMKVRKKLAFNPIVKGKCVILVDDSIVRGTTARLVAELLQEGGAREVHMRIAYPPFVGGCPSGTDVPDRDTLIAHGHDSITAIERAVEAATGATSVRYISRDGLYQAMGTYPTHFCDGCITRKWVFPLTDPKYKTI